MVLLGHHYLPPETHGQGVSVSRTGCLRVCVGERVCVCVCVVCGVWCSVCVCDIGLRPFENKPAVGFPCLSL